VGGLWADSTYRYLHWLGFPMVPLVLQCSECLLFWHPVAPVLDLSETSQATQINK